MPGGSKVKGIHSLNSQDLFMISWILNVEMPKFLEFVH